VATNTFEEIKSVIESKFEDSILGFDIKGGRIMLKVNARASHEVLSLLKDLGFDHLSDVTGIDYIRDGEFEIVYHLWSHARKIRAMLKVRISREAPILKSIADLWPGAQIHERENYELLGIDFEGNPDLSPLFLENWEEIPPLRKDFDTREFVKRKYHDDK